MAIIKKARSATPCSARRGMEMRVLAGINRLTRIDYCHWNKYPLKTP